LVVLDDYLARSVLQQPATRDREAIGLPRRPCQPRHPWLEIAQLGDFESVDDDDDAIGLAAGLV
jgi:hypothetical protein